MSDRLGAALADKYRIERELGAGGMATVYLAEDLKHGRQVAIKVLREDLSASLGSGRFLREIRIAAQLQHPNILPLLDSGETDGFLYFVMPYIKGQSLRDRLTREGELPVHEAVRLITEVVDALVHAHEHGVVHRDIKPDNVMLSGRHALVTDFGVAKAISEATGRNTVTTMGVALGTPMYMSPEQAAADPHVDHRSDIYSVGVMAYEMLSGRPPFTGPTPQQILAAHVTEVPDSVSKRREAIPHAVEQVVMRCLAKRPADRFQTSAELLAMLEPLATPSTGITPTHTRPIESVRIEAANGNRGKWMLAGAAVVVAVAGLVAFQGKSKGEGTVSPIAVQTTALGDVSRGSISPDGTRVAYAKRRCDAAKRCVYDLVVQDIGGAGTLVAASGASGIYATSWSRDGRYLMMYGSFLPEWGNYVVPATVQGAPKRIGCCGGQFLTNADSAIIVPLIFPGDTASWVRVMTTADSRVRDSIYVRHTDFVGSMVYPSPDGARLAVIVGFQNTKRLLRLTKRDGTVTDSLIMGLSGSVHWMPDGGSLLFAVPVATTVELYNVVHARVDRSGRFASKLDTIWRRASIRDGALSVSADGVTMALVQGPIQSKVVSLRRKSGAAEFTQRVIATATSPLGGEISPDGTQILLSRRIIGSERAKIQLSLMPADSGAETNVSPPIDTLIDRGWVRASGAGVFYSFPGGEHVDRVDAYDVATRRTLTIGTVADSQANRGLYHLPDGRLLVFNVPGREILVSATPNAPSHTIRFPAGISNYLAAAVSASGDEVLLGGWDAGTQDSATLYRIRVADGSARHVAAMPAEGVFGLQVLTNGDILAAIGETAETIGLYRLPPNGKLQRLGLLPFGSSVVYSIARDGLRFVAAVNEPRGDVWLVRNLDKMIRR